jgi:hypothetical protein
MRLTALRSLLLREQIEETNGKLRRETAREKEETWLFDNLGWNECARQ